MERIGLTGYIIAAAGFALLTLLMLNDKKQSLPARLLFCSVILTALWAAGFSWQIATEADLRHYMPLELFRSASWGLLLLATIQGSTRLGALWQPQSAFGWLIPLLALCLIIDTLHALGWFDSPFYLFAGHLTLSIANLILIEYLYRQGSASFRWSFKPLAIALACISVFDLVIYAKGLLFRQLDFSLWYARGFIAALALPFILISVRRVELWAIRVFVSRQVVFHSTMLIGAGIYLALMAAAGYYIRYLDGAWGSIGQILFLALALMLLAMLFLSGALRRRVKVFISKHFFSNRYDYRQQWLALNQTLESGSDNRDYYATATSAICQLIQSGSGMLFRYRGNHQFEPVGQYQLAANAAPWQRLLNQLEDHQPSRQWILDLDEYDQYPDIYQDLAIELTPVQQQPLRIILPLQHREQRYGYFLLSRPDHGELLNYEDRDLLHTVGQQLTNFLVLHETSNALLETSQFDAFNRMSAFMVHDLKNVVGQLSLVLANAPQHRDNPAFIDDAFDTLDNAVTKMNTMLDQLRRKQNSGGTAQPTALKALLIEACQQQTLQLPKPRLIRAQDLYAHVDRDNLLNIIKHLIQNSQDATGQNGYVHLNLNKRKREIQLQITDNGCGMDAEFVRQRLFKPFDTTKGNAGMGIGAYEAKLFFEQIGGRIEVTSAPGKGSCFSLYIPASLELPQTAARQPVKI